MSHLAGVKLAIWDLDGTIIDSHRVFMAVLTELAAEQGFTMPDEALVRQHFHGTLEDTLAGVLGISDAEALELLKSAFLRLQDKYYEAALLNEYVYADARALAERLHQAGVRQILVTNRAHAGHGNASPRHIIPNGPLGPFISDIVTSDESRKPDPAVLSGIDGAQDLQGHEILVIGDQFVDAMLARNLSAKAILINRTGAPVAHLDTIGDHSHFLTEVLSLDHVE